MLENFCYCDSHFHLSECLKREKSETILKKLDEFNEYYACTCAHSKEEWYEQQKAIEIIKENDGDRKKVNIFSSFGLHPQNPLIENADFLELLLKKNQISCVGESGFDLFTKEFRENLLEQKKAFYIQVELSIKYQKPLVLHVRKGSDFIFENSKILSKVPVLLFHSFYGPSLEAFSILRKLPSSYFSFSKQILNGNKKSISCIQNLPLENLLLETDAPFQTLKNEDFTSFSEIKKIYEKAFSLRNELTPEKLKENFCRLFNFL